MATEREINQFAYITLRAAVGHPAGHRAMSAARRKFMENAPVEAKVVELSKPLTLTGALKYPSARLRWALSIVLIYSTEHAAFWRDGGVGYTAFVDKAGRYPFEAALACTKHCGREKGIVFYRAPKQ